MEATESQETRDYNTWCGRGSFTPLPPQPAIDHVSPAAVSLTTTRSTVRRSSARCEAELIQARSRISHLQLQLELSKTHQAVKRIRTEDWDNEEEEEEEEERVRERLATSQELRRLHTLDEERQSLTKQLAEAQQSLKDREKEEGEEMIRLKTLVADLERKDRERSTREDELQSELKSLRNRNTLLSRQLELARSETVTVRESLDGQLQTMTTTTRGLRDRVRELEGVKDKFEAEQERVKGLSHKLKHVKHDIQFAESVQSKLLHGETVEREMRQLQEENRALRSHADNIGLMRYQLQTLREVMDRNKDMEMKAVRLEEENILLQKQLAGGDEDSSRTTAGSVGLKSEVTQLRHREVVLLGQVGELESKLKLSQRTAERTKTEAEETKIQLTREQEECKTRGEKIQRLEKRLLFVSKLRDGCVNVLNSYRLESGVDALLKQNLVEVEKQLSTANERITELEAEVEQLLSSQTTVTL